MVFVIMRGVFAIAAGAALMLFMAGAAAPGIEAAAQASDQTGSRPERALEPGGGQAGGVLDWFRAQLSAGQVRIEQRVMIRVAPAPSMVRQDLRAPSQRPVPARQLIEGQKEKCVPLQDIARVETGSGNRLVLFLRDRRMISVNLEKACHARDFYAGFYVEPRKDGRLCVDRDKLQSRTGARCEVDAMRQLVAEED